MSVSNLSNQKYWYPAYYIEVDIEDVSLIDIKGKHAVISVENIQNLTVNRMKRASLESPLSLELVLPLSGNVNFNDMTLMRKMFGPSLTQTYMKKRRVTNKGETF